MSKKYWVVFRDLQGSWIYLSEQPGPKKLIQDLEHADGIFNTHEEACKWAEYLLSRQIKRRIENLQHIRAGRSEKKREKLLIKAR